jgi:hypothetical protein
MTALTLDRANQLFQKARLGRISPEDADEISSQILGIDPNDVDSAGYILIEAAGNAIASGVGLGDRQDRVFDRLNSWATKDFCPELAGTALHCLVFKWKWITEEAKDRIMSFLAPSHWDENHDALMSAISAAAAYAKHAKFQDKDISRAIEDLRRSRDIPVAIKEHITQML